MKCNFIEIIDKFDKLHETPELMEKSLQEKLQNINNKLKHIFFFFLNFIQYLR